MYFLVAGTLATPYKWFTREDIIMLQYYRIVL